MSYPLFFNAPDPTQQLTTQVDALGLYNEAWYIPPTISPETEAETGDYKNALDLVKAIDLTNGLRHWADLTGTFITGDFIEALFVHFNLHTKTLYIDHYVLSQNNIDSFGLLLEKGYVDRIEMMISDYWFRNEVHGLVPYIYEKLNGVAPDGKARFQLGVSRTHKKLVCFTTDKGTPVVIHGSANLRSSDCDEHLMIEANQSLYDRLVPRIERKISRYKTINEDALLRALNPGNTRSQTVSAFKSTRCLTRNETWLQALESTQNTTAPVAG